YFARASTRSGRSEAASTRGPSCDHWSAGVVSCEDHLRTVRETPEPLHRNREHHTVYERGSTMTSATSRARARSRGSPAGGSAKPAAPPHPGPPAGTPVRLTGARSLVRSLEAVGVEVVFGIPGGTILPAYDPLLDSTKLRHVLVRHEQGAGHAATGYAQASGKVGVCMATSGPGATNLVTPLA